MNAAATPNPRSVSVGAFWQLLGLSAFAVAQPVFDILGRHPEFLVVHRTTPFDLIALMLLLVIAPAALLYGVERLVGLAHQRAGEWAHRALLTGLVGLILLPPLARLGSLPTAVVIALALAVGATTTWLLLRYRRVYRQLKLLAWAAPVFVGVFLFNPAISRLVYPRQVEVAAVGGSSATPVVLVVFDALPTCSLLDQDQRIDPLRYPNLRRLADRSVWYRNATSINDATLIAVPAILTGKQPRPDRQAVYADHPENLFTMLQDTHDLWVFETQTNLLPGGLATPTPEQLAVGFGARWRRLLADLPVVYLHVVLPAGLRDGLPAINDAWIDFAADADAGARANFRSWSRTKIFEEFVSAYTPGEKPGCLFLHSVLPHSPYLLYPSGTIYAGAWREPGGEGAPGTPWSDDTFTVLQGYQRHLLQLGLVDALVGRLVARLEQLGLFDQTLVIITADHGISFRPGDFPRSITPTNFSDIMSVPLLIKLPNQQTGRIDDRSMPSMDVLPTIADALDLDVPWEFDGHSALDPDFAPPDEVVYYVDDLPHRYASAEIHVHRAESLRRKLEIFGTGTGNDGLYRWGAYGDLVGRTVDGLVVDGLVVEPGSDTAAGAPAGAPAGTAIRPRVRLEKPGRFRKVRLDAGQVPGFVSGVVETPPDQDGPVHLALAVNGIVAGVVPPYSHKPDATLLHWGMVVADDLFQAGNNTIDCWLVHGEPTRPRLEPVLVENTELSYLGVNLGGRHVAGTAESGFLRSFRGDGAFFRWTEGHGVLQFPLREDETPDELVIGLSESSPEGTTLRIVVNDSVLFEETIAPGPWRRTLALDAVPRKNWLKLEVISDTFFEHKRTRPYGVAVETVLVRER